MPRLNHSFHHIETAKTGHVFHCTDQKISKHTDNLFTKSKLKTCTSICSHSAGIQLFTVTYSLVHIELFLHNVVSQSRKAIPEGWRRSRWHASRWNSTRWNSTWWNSARWQGTSGRRSLHSWWWWTIQHTCMSHRQMKIMHDFNRFCINLCVVAHKSQLEQIIVLHFKPYFPLHFINHTDITEIINLTFHLPLSASSILPRSVLKERKISSSLLD